MTYSLMNNTLLCFSLFLHTSAAGEDLTLHLRASTFFSYPSLLGDEMWGWGCERWEGGGASVGEMMVKGKSGEVQEGVKEVKDERRYTASQYKPYLKEP